MNLRTGYTTGACATAAAKAATTLLCTGVVPRAVEIILPEGKPVCFPIMECRTTDAGAVAAVQKDAGDDPDITHQARILVEVAFSGDDEIHFAAGEGVGTVTKPGLSIPPGEPAINPGPRRMIGAACREITSRGLVVTIAIPGGCELAEKTFNPRLGITGGLSVIGTTGIVKPFSAPAVTASLQCALDVAAASGVTMPVLVPGNIGERAAHQHFALQQDQVIQVSNHWGFMLDQAAAEPGFQALLVLGHPGKLAKVIDGEWDTHSSNSASATGVVTRIAENLFLRPVAESATVEGIFAACAPDDSRALGNALAAAVRSAIAARLAGKSQPVAVALINMNGDILGADGDFSPWK